MWINWTWTWTWYVHIFSAVVRSHTKGTSIPSYNLMVQLKHSACSVVRGAGTKNHEPAISVNGMMQHHSPSHQLVVSVDVPHIVRAWHRVNVSSYRRMETWHGTIWVDVVCSTPDSWSLNMETASPQVTHNHRFSSIRMASPNDFDCLTNLSLTVIGKALVVNVVIADSFI